MQLLVGLGFAIAQLKRSRVLDQDREIIAEMEQLLGETQQEIRSISYIAHPPLLKEIGLASALQALCDGFGRRTGIRVNLRFDGEPSIAWAAAEVTMYRVVQEALSNVHRHANATEIEVALVMRASLIHIVVADNGSGMPIGAPSGVGLASMRERVRTLGGRLSIRTKRPGTTIIASLPPLPIIKAVGDLAMQV